MQKNVWWAYLAERSMPQDGVAAISNLAMRAGYLGYTRITRGYGRTDMARNHFARKFLAESKNDADTLIMLDCDHTHPITTFEQLVEANKGVVGALAFLRGEPFNPCAFVRDAAGEMHPLAEWDGSVIPVSTIGHAAIAIQRWVFRELESKGLLYPWWQYEYRETKTLFADGTYRGDEIAEWMPSEDMYFGKLCRIAEITQYCHTGLISPHLYMTLIDDLTFNEYRAEHAELQQVVTAQVMEYERA